MSTTQTAVILLSLMSCVTTCIGVLLALWLRENGRAIAAGIGFSVGIMILVSTLELLPEAVATMGMGTTAASAAAGVGLVWAANLLIPHAHLIDESGAADKAILRSAYLVVFGLILHDVPEGYHRPHRTIGVVRRRGHRNSQEVKDTCTRILIGTDGSPAAEHALRHAALLARTTPAKLRIVHVVDMGWLPIGPELAARPRNRLGLRRRRRYARCQGAVRYRRRRRDSARQPAQARHRPAIDRHGRAKFLSNPI